MKRRLPILILLIAAAAAAYYFYLRNGSDDPPRNRLTLSGNIEAHESLVGFKVQGRIAELPVQEGQWIEKGALLARLDDRDLHQQVTMETATMRVREANLQLALAGPRSQEIEMAEQAVADAEADLELKKLDYARAVTLLKKDVISQQDHDRAKTQLDRAQATYKRTAERLSELRAGTRQEEIAIARANVTQAREAVEMSRVRLSFTELRAPATGVILVRQAELGEVVSVGSPVVTLADLDNVWLRAYVPETDLGRIRHGQEVAVRTDTFPGKTYRGRISFISQRAEFTPKTIETHKERVTLVYRIKIDLENPNHELKPGMPADASIELRPPATQTTKR
ncbi:MAG: efflux RND transporter periplasmic adaptor subunit [Candidatus Acidiferrales bacterium]